MTIVEKQYAHHRFRGALSSWTPIIMVLAAIAAGVLVGGYPGAGLGIGVSAIALHTWRAGSKRN